MCFRYFAALSVGLYFVCILIASRSLPWLNTCTVSLKHETALSDPLLEQRWIVLELEQGRSNLLRFWDFSVRGVKAGLPVYTLGIGRVSQPPDISVAHSESRRAYI